MLFSYICENFFYMANIIFISGTGRSGTHLIGRSISSSKEIIGRIEVDDTFSLITDLATKQAIYPFYKNLYKKYKINKLLSVYANSVNSKYILEKSHPSLWLYKDLKNSFPASKFIGVYRKPEPTISSMLQHKGVLSWFNLLPDNKTNPFLGINQANKHEYKDYSLVEKCYLRWKSHFDKLQEMKSHLGNDCLIIEYDDFVINIEDKLNEISNFLEVNNDFNIEKIQISSLTKWEEFLSEKQKIEILECRKRFN